MPQWFRRLGVTALVTKTRDRLIKSIRSSEPMVNALTDAPRATFKQIVDSTNVASDIETVTLTPMTPERFLEKRPRGTPRPESHNGDVCAEGRRPCRQNVSHGRQALGR